MYYKNIFHDEFNNTFDIKNIDFFISLIKFKMVRLGIILEFRGQRVFDKERNNHHLIGSMYLNKLLEKANHQASKTHKGAFQLYQVEGRPVTFAGDRQ